MFSVNIDKIVTMTDKERQCYNELVETLKTELRSKKCVAIINNGISAFKLAYSFVETGDRTIFIDGDIMSEIFLGKYRLGKDLRGVTDYMMGTGRAHDLICKTNNSDLDIVFTGVLDDGIVSDAEEAMMQELISIFSSEYDRIVVSSDAEGRVAKYCDGTVVMYNESEFGELAAQNYTEELENNKCNVLGVVINE